MDVTDDPGTQDEPVTRHASAPHDPAPGYGYRGQPDVTAAAFLPDPYHPVHLKAAVKDSLPRLATDYLDLGQLHRADDTVPLQESWSALADLIQARMVRSTGRSDVRAASLTLDGGDLRGTRCLAGSGRGQALMPGECRQWWLALAEAGRVPAIVTGGPAHHQGNRKGGVPA